jgi:hypothetical protein
VADGLLVLVGVLGIALKITPVAVISHGERSAVDAAPGINRKVRAESGLNLSQNSFLISVSQKVSCRLSFERVHADKTDKDRSHGLAGQSTTPHCEEGRASTFNATRYRPHDVETDADRLRPRFDH